MGYWEDRLAKSQSKLTTKNIKATEAQLKKYYKKAMDDVIGQFEKTYQHLLSSMDEGREPTPADLYNLDKYWQMQAQLKTKLQKLGDSSYKLMSGQFENQYKTIYNSLSLPSGGAFNTITDENIKQMILQIWCADGKSWSDRIWTNTDKLQQALNDNLINCVLTGKKPTELKQMLMKDFNVSFNNADTIVRTEMAHIQTQAAMQRYRDYGITEVEILADKDERQCEVCGKLHKKRYPTGANVPIPAHPRCRCTVIPVVEQKGTLNLIVDELVPCLKDTKTGEILPTVVTSVDTKSLKGYNKRNGWYVNWQQLSKEGCEVYSVKIKDSDVIEGLIALKREPNAIYISWAVNAPHNSPFSANKKYTGVGGHLFAIAAEEAMKHSNGNMYAFATDMDLVDYYVKEFNAEYIGILHDYHVVWDKYACKRLLEVYNYERL